MTLDELHEDLLEHTRALEVPEDVATNIVSWVMNAVSELTYNHEDLHRERQMFAGMAMAALAPGVQRGSSADSAVTLAWQLAKKLQDEEPSPGR